MQKIDHTKVHFTEGDDFMAGSKTFSKPNLIEKESIKGLDKKV